MASLIIDDISFDCASYDIATTNKNKDYEMMDGSVVRYQIVNNYTTLSCKLILDKSELQNFKNLFLDDVEHTIQYRQDGLNTIYALLDGTISYKKIVFIGYEDEVWEVSLSLKECRR